jgi:hypothetical protein
VITDEENNYQNDIVIEITENSSLDDLDVGIDVSLLDNGPPETPTLPKGYKDTSYDSP